MGTILRAFTTGAQRTQRSSVILSPEEGEGSQVAHALRMLRSFAVCAAQDDVRVSVFSVVKA